MSSAYLNIDPQDGFALKSNGCSPVDSTGPGLTANGDSVECICCAYGLSRSAGTETYKTEQREEKI